MADAIERLDELVGYLEAVNQDRINFGGRVVFTSDLQELLDANTRQPQLPSDDGLIKALEAEILRLVDALQFAHSSGFEWPADPLPFGSLAHDLFIRRGNDPERIAAREALSRHKAPLSVAKEGGND